MKMKFVLAFIALFATAASALAQGTNIGNLPSATPAPSYFVPFDMPNPANTSGFSTRKTTIGAIAPKTMTQVLTGSNSWPQWVASFTAGGRDANGVFMGGTEGRQFAVKNPLTLSAQLYLGNGYWGDNPGAEGQQNAQVLRLDKPENEGGAWLQDVSLGATGLALAPTGGDPQAVVGTSFCPTDNPICALATGALQTLSFTIDAGNNALNPPVTVVVAASWFSGSTSVAGYACANTPVFAFARNNTDHLWYQTMMACDSSPPGYGTPQIRSFGTHIDLNVTPNIDYAFAGEGGSGIFNGQLSASRLGGHNVMAWNTGLSNLEWNSSAYTGPAITHQVRVMGFAEAKGPDNVNRLYASAGFSILLRQDGPRSTCGPTQVMIASVCQPRWIDYWDNPNPGSSQSGNRGLTFTTDGILLTGAEGSPPQSYYAVKPFPGCASPTDPSCTTVEYGVIGGTSAATGGLGIGNTVAPYNNFPQIFDEAGLPHYLAPQTNYITAISTVIPPGFSFLYLGGTGSGKKLGEATYTYRTSPGKYAFVAIPQLFPTAMNGIRDMINSPFIDDCGLAGASILQCAIYATGFDDDGASTMSWCTANPCSSLIYVPVHNTAWAAKLTY